MGRQLLYDSRCWRDVRGALLVLAPLLADPFGPDLADVNWRRLQPVRQALAHALESSGTTRRQSVMSVQIRHRSGEAALAWLLAGWLQSVWDAGLARRIRLKPDPTITPDLTITPDPTITDSTIAVEEDARLTDVVLMVSFDDGLQLQLENHQVRVDDALGPAPFVMTVPGETAAEAVAAELRVLTHDVSLHGALGALVARFARA
jgi:glucose-6-phosphate dehydrogenase assembly protein OpcA